MLFMILENTGLHMPKKADTPLSTFKIYWVCDNEISNLDFLYHKM